MAGRQDLCARTFAFARAVLELHPRLVRESPAHASMAEQLFNAAASIGANVEEGQVAATRRDMASKYAIALREAREARYWLRLFASDARWTQPLDPLIQESGELVAILTTSVRKLREPPPSWSPARSRS